MLAPFAIAILGITVLATSFVSGLFGMAGGMMLLGVLLFIPGWFGGGDAKLMAKDVRATLVRAFADVRAISTAAAEQPAHAAK